MLVADVIRRKRNGEEIPPGEWHELLDAYARGDVPDYQMSALLMAIYFSSVSATELDAITDAMIASGATLAFNLAKPVVDKHSTGGVGDKVSLVLAPLAACCGVAVPMMSGRGLGHTGGTLDKLEAIPGFRTRLSLTEAREQTASLGCALFGQTEEIAPIDRRLYALRDVTGTVEIVPLIAASIMSKKLAEGLDALVLDVKTGSGAFLPELADGLGLARTMVGLGEHRGCRTVALVTAMDRPLGRACGNGLETMEAIATLRGEGPDDLLEVTLALGAEMLTLTGTDVNRRAARTRLREALDSGAAYEMFERIVVAQGGDAGVLARPELLRTAPVQATFEARATGYVQQVEPRHIGQAIVAMGGGRKSVDAGIDPGVGVVIERTVGEYVEEGTPVAIVHGASQSDVNVGLVALGRAVTIGDAPPTPPPLVSHRVTAEGVEEWW